MLLRESLFASFLTVMTVGCATSTAEDLTNLTAASTSAEGVSDPIAAQVGAVRPSPRTSCDELEELVLARAVR